MLLHSVIKAFLAERAGKGGAPNAEVHLRHFQALPNIRMSDITLDQLQEVVDARRKSTSHNTLVVTVSYWNALCRFAEDRKWATAIKLPRMAPIKTKLRYLSASEEAGLFAAIDPQAQYPNKTKRSDAARQDNTDLLLCLIHTGCRYAEIARMTWGQVDLANKKLVVYRLKGGTDSTLIMSDRLHEALARRKAMSTSDWVFPTKRRFNNNFSWMRAAALKVAGITGDAGKITLHCARHSYASRMLQSGISLLEVQSLLGHKNIQSTLVYSHFESGALAEKAAAVLNARV